MPEYETHIPIALEIGKTRTFAVAVDHPGWSRDTRDETAAIQSLPLFDLNFDAFALLLKTLWLGF